jgi:SAM-dependent methyltransferase
MADTSFGELRIWDGSRSGMVRGPAPPLPPGSSVPPGDVPASLAEELAAQEVLRASATSREPIEPLSLQWFQDLQAIRHSRQGHWIPRLLEFTRHSGERLLGLGGGLGSDLVEYARHGTEVVAVCPSAAQLSLIRRNFELRGMRGLFLHASPTALPLEPASIDVVLLTGLSGDLTEPAPLVDEIYRLLKPGGKLLAVLPAHYDIERLRRWVPLGEPGPAPAVTGGLLAATARRFRGRELRQLFGRFSEPRIYKRHLRRSEVPHLWRWLPVGLLERLAGRLLVFKGFKPVSSAIAEQAAA